MDLMRGSEEERLDALFLAFRECPTPDPSANFMPTLWARIESRQRFTFSFRRMAGAFVTAALALSGLVEGPFYFMGFLPRQGKRRRAALDRVTRTSDPVVLFESPQRIGATLGELALLQPERAAVVCRELTKVHEEVRRGRLANLSSELTETRGEFVIVLGPYGLGEPDDAETAIPDAALRERLCKGESPRTILEDLQLSGKQRREMYSRLLALAETIKED